MFEDYSSAKRDSCSPEPHTQVSSSRQTYSSIPPASPEKTKATWLFAIHQALKHEGVDADKLFKAHEVSLSSFKNSLSPVPKATVNRIWQDAVQLTQNDAFGLSLIKHFNLPYLNSLASLAQASRDIEQALLVLEKYHCLVTDNVAIKVLCDNEIKIRIMNKSAGETWLPEDIEIAFALILQYGASLPVEEIKPLRLSLTRKQPDNLEHYTGVFHCPIEFNASEAAIYFSKEALHYPIPSANRMLFSQFEKLLDERMPSASHNAAISSLTDRTLLYLKSLPGTKFPCLQQTAAHFFMSASCFKKHLQAEGSSFQQLADQVRKEHALELLARLDKSLKEIAYELGFANSSAFNRAFKRWTGGNPKVYREKFLKPSAPESRV